MMPSQPFRRPYRQLSDIKHGRIVGMLEAGWSYRAIGRHLPRTDTATAIVAVRNLSTKWPFWKAKIHKCEASSDDCSTGLICSIGAISYDSRSSLVIFHASLTAHRYVDTIPRPVVLSFMERHPGTSFQHDIARSYTTPIFLDCLRVTLPLTTRSPDLSPIEYA
ncbi:transposable element Tc1 transposase [Trichonephila clavipes]|uniref:Transposable element Tc1 transposase n=1 Tax=Trichonephila clavipes TaxID=2585209 RepID=A0A8X6W9D6_TRICX|nr:transposable element Tc1 transposase [Trichonephila clavipes]